MPLAIGDIRTEARGELLVERIASTGSVVVKELGGNRAGEQAVHRFLSSPYVSPDSIVDTLAARTGEQCAGRHIVAIQDTTEINFVGRCKRRHGFGPAGNGKDPGYFIHAVIAVDVEAAAVVGLVGADIWTRPQAPATARRTRAIEGKELMRWLDGCAAAATVLDQAASVTVISDREGDIYEHFARRPAGVEHIVRVAQNRLLENRGRVFEALENAPLLEQHTLTVPIPGPGNRTRTAVVGIKAGSVRIRRPRYHKPDPAKPEHLDLTLVEVREINPPDPKAAICWRLYTTHEVRTAEHASRIVALYKLRWRIEQVFRALKGDGLHLEDSQIADCQRMFNLAAVALAGAVRTLQLVDARDGSPRPATDVIDAGFLTPLARLSKQLEGKTERQKNPHPPASLAWLAWIIARLGGWNCYYKPPGPKTMRNGWTKLSTFLSGYAFATMAEADV